MNRYLLIALLACIGSADCQTTHPTKQASALKEEPYKCKDGESLGTQCGNTCVALICKNNRAVIDEAATKERYDYIAKEEKTRADLIWAMRTRVLTDKEMETVRNNGAQILVPMCLGMCSVTTQAELEKTLNDLLFQQTKLRAIKHDASPGLTRVIQSDTCKVYIEIADLESKSTDNVQYITVECGEGAGTRYSFPMSYLKPYRRDK